MKMPGRERRGKGKVELMMTPMIDIVFNLVIFFLLMPSFEAKEGYLPTNLPKTTGVQKAKVIKEQTFRIDLKHVTPWDGNPANQADCIIRLNRADVADNKELRERLTDAFNGLTEDYKNKAPVTISPDMVVWQKHVVAAFDAAIDAGFKNIRFTVPK
jgi:biopolymer transport protein ExbD